VKNGLIFSAGNLAKPPRGCALIAHKRSKRSEDELEITFVVQQWGDVCDDRAGAGRIFH